MIGILINLVIFLLVLGVIWWALTLIPIPEPFGLIARVVIGVIFLIVLLTQFLMPLIGYGGVYHHPY